MFRESPPAGAVTFHYEDGGMVRADEGDLPSVRRPGWIAIVAGLLRQLPNIAAACSHREDLGVAGAIAGEGDSCSR